MSDEVYYRLREVLDTLPNGFPQTENEVEIKILKMIFSPGDAELFCDLRLSFETPEQIAERTGRPLEGLDDHLKSMWEKGQIFSVDFGTVRVYKMAAWVFGIFEFQIKRMTKEFALLCKEYEEAFGTQFFSQEPQMMNVIPVEKEMNGEEVAMPYDQVSAIIEKGKSFGLNECICKKEHMLLDKPCDRPTEVCLAIAPIPDFFVDHPMGIRPITKEEAYEVLRISEEAGLVHMTNNVQNGHFYICNCCGCCCGVLRSINEFGIKNAVNNSYYAVIDGEECVSCGVCADERCQVFAIAEADGSYEVDREKCIGCGLCISTCPTEAISLVRKSEEEIVKPPVNEEEWNAMRSKMRGVDYGAFA